MDYFKANRDYFLLQELLFQNGGGTPNVRIQVGTIFNH